MIRPVRPEDRAALEAIDRAVLLDGRGQVRVPEEPPAPSGATWVAELGGRVVGEATLRVLSPSLLRHVGALDLQLHPDAQGRGLGRALMDAIVAEACARGLDRLELSVRADNERAIGLYRRFGFAVAHTRRGYVRLPDGREVDDHAMVRFLGGPDLRKAVAVVVRGEEVLVLQHPTAGWQLPRGTVEAGETPEEAVVREVAEETGLAGLGVGSELGWWTERHPSGRRFEVHGFVLRAPPDAPDAWDHAAVGSVEEDGLVFRLSFQPRGVLARVVAETFAEPMLRLSSVVSAGPTAPLPPGPARAR